MMNNKEDFVEYLEDYIKEYPEVYDRFTFDNLFRLLLSNDFEHEEALNFVFCNCSLSTLVFQERIYNKYYLNLSTEDTISDDLVVLRNQFLFELTANKYLDINSKVGPVSELIRKCPPKSLKDWEEYYYNSVYPKEHIEDLGRRLYIKITEVLSAEVEEITEEDCIEYMFNIVLNRTFDGYMTEIKTIYGQLEKILNMKIQPAPDEWDRLCNVDFFIKIGESYIGLQIKPAGNVSHIPQIFKEHSIQESTHKKFTEKYGGKVFYIISIKEGGKKKIHNTEVITEIEQEIKRLQK